MAGIIHKIGETLHMGGDKKEEHKPEQHHGEHRPEQHNLEHKPVQQYPGDVHKGEEHKAGFMDQIKGKIHGEPGAAGEGEKKKKKKKDGEKKKHEDGHSSSSSSDSD